MVISGFSITSVIFFLSPTSRCMTWARIFSIWRFFFGEPCSLYAREFRIDPRFAGQDIVSITLAYPEFTCHCELSWRTTTYEVFIEGTDGTIMWNPEGRITIRTNTGGFSETLVPQSYSWADRNTVSLIPASSRQTRTCLRRCVAKASQKPRRMTT